MKKQYSIGVSLLYLSVFLTGCATKPAIKSAGGEPLNLGDYQAVVVSDFGDKATPPGTDTRHQDSRDQVRSAGRNFADLIASEIRKTQSFREVVREGTPAAPTLLVGGNITRYERGDVTFRRTIGLGAGSCYFDASVEIKDGKTGKLLGTVTVDRSSFVLGGDIAASETPEVFMEQAARRIAKEIGKIRSGGPSKI
jgi:hypothetical protein